MFPVVAKGHNAANYARTTLVAARNGDIRTLLSPRRLIHFLFNAYYVLVELMIIWLFKPVREYIPHCESSLIFLHLQPVPPEHFKPRGRIAVIGAGLTGVSSAAHAIAHGFDVVIYEQSDSIGT